MGGRMRAVGKLVSRLATGLQMAGFALTILVALPLILLKFGVDFAVDSLRDRIEARWPDSDRARAVSFALKLLTPVFVLILLWVLMHLALAQSRGK